MTSDIRKSLLIKDSCGNHTVPCTHLYVKLSTFNTNNYYCRLPLVARGSRARVCETTVDCEFKLSVCGFLSFLSTYSTVRVLNTRYEFPSISKSSITVVCTFLYRAACLYRSVVEVHHKLQVENS